METILIYDDQPAVCFELKCFLQQVLAPEWADIHTACSMTEAQELLTQRHFSIIFLDIELEEQNSGIDFAQGLQTSDPDISLVYITAHIKYCEDIFQTDPSAFLLKPFTEERVRNVLSLIDSKRKRELILELHISKNSVKKIQLDRISYIETINRRLTFYDLECRKVHEFYGKKLAWISEQLPDSFLQCHQSICVNLKLVDKICRYHFTLRNGKQIPISQSRFQETKERYLAFLGGSL